MSYSEYINIYGVNKEKIDYKRVERICNEIYKPNLIDGGYWDGNENIYEFISNSFIKNDSYNYLFHFCNHDGINDDEVHKCHRIYCKVFNIIYSSLIKHTSQIYGEDSEIYNIILDEDNYIYNYEKPLDEDSNFYELLHQIELRSKIKDIDNIEELKNSLIEK